MGGRKKIRKNSKKAKRINSNRPEIHISIESFDEENKENLRRF